MEQVEFKITKGGVPKLTGATEVANGQEAIKITSDADDSDWTFWAYSTPDAMKKLEQIGVFEVSGVEVHLAYGKPHKGRTVIAYASDYMLGETHDGRFAKRALYIWIPYMWREGYEPRRNPLAREREHIRSENQEPPSTFEANEAGDYAPTHPHPKTAGLEIRVSSIDMNERMERIIYGIKSYPKDGRRKIKGRRKGAPRLPEFRAFMVMPDITRKERNQAWEMK